MDDYLEFVECVDSYGKKDGKITLNPEIYSESEDSYFDKLENKKINSEQLSKQMDEAVNPLVLRNYEPNIKSEAELDKYVEFRKKKIQEAMEKAGSNDVVQNDDRSETLLSNLFLMSTKDRRLRCSFVTLDLRGFTKMGQSMPSADLTRLATVLSKEMSVLTYEFNGFVLKYMGDGHVAYFTAPNILAAVDSSLYYSHALRRIIIEVINPIFDQNGLPKLKFGVGVEAGIVNITRVGSWQTKTHHDLIGPPINITFKTQTLSKENEILVAEKAFRYASPSWKNKLKEVKLPSTWTYTPPSEEKKTPEEIELEFKKKNDPVEKFKTLVGLAEKNSEKVLKVYSLE
ncbi:hypothetical protein KJ780_03625 [Candidatus Micrarchaeota archaeon]|nr:hypothetical protein [Candidatus Micrarchaeota archaeon]